MLKPRHDQLQKGQNRYLVSYTVAMQPLLSSVTLVSVWSRSDGHTCMHVCTYRHTDFHIHAVATLASLQIVTLSQTPSYTSAFAYKSPQGFFFSFFFFQTQQELPEGSQTRPRRDEAR